MEAQAAPVEKVVPQPNSAEILRNGAAAAPSSPAKAKVQPTAEEREAAASERERVYEEELRQVLGRKDREPLTAEEREHARYLRAGGRRRR